jgi:tetratricopeptide (TPR) repeat protein
MELNLITKAVEKAGILNAQVSQRQALIYFEMGMYHEALEKFKSLLNLEDAAFSFYCMEKYCNTRAKISVSNFLGSGIFKSNAEAERKQALTEIGKVIDDLNILCNTGRTAERLNLLASAYKRKALLLSDKDQRVKAYKSSIACYLDAADVDGNNHSVYSITNAIEIECLLVLSGAISWGKEFTVSDKTYFVSPTGDAKLTLDNLKEKISKGDGLQNLNYWDMVAAINIDLCMLLLGEKQNQSKADERWDAISTSFNQIWLKAGSQGKRIAELEHLQFLHYTLSMAKKEIKITSPDQIIRTDKADAEELANAIRQLRIVYDAATEKPKKSTPAKTKTKTIKKSVEKKAVKKKK